MTNRPYREDRNPCVECARHEAEGPRVPWWTKVYWVTRWLPFVMLVYGVISISVTYIKRPIPAPPPPAPIPAPHCYIATWDPDRTCLWLDRPPSETRRVSCHGNITDAIAAAKQLGCPLENR